MSVPDNQRIDRTRGIPSPIPPYMEPMPREHSFEKLSLPSLDGHYAYDERPIVFYHWQHIHARVPQLIADIRQQITAKDPQTVHIYHEQVGSTPKERRSIETFQTDVINGKWYTRPYLWLAKTAARLVKDGPQKEGLLFESALLDGLWRTQKESNTRIELHSIDAHKFDYEFVSVNQMLHYLKNFNEFFSQHPSIILDYDLNGTEFRDYLRHGARQVLGAHRYSISARDALVKKQLQQHLGEANPKDLHIILTGAGHKSLARTIPASLQKRRVLVLSENVLARLPDEFRSVALVQPVSYAITRMESYSGAARDREVDTVLLGHALTPGIDNYLNTHSAQYRNFTREERDTLSNILSMHVIHSMTESELTTVTQSFFESLNKQYRTGRTKGSSIGDIIAHSSVSFWKHLYQNGDVPLNPMVKKAFNRLTAQSN